MIKNLLFDLGGVIIDIDRNRCVEALEKLGVADADSLLGKYVQSGIFADLESGNISAAEFRDALRRHAGNPALTDSDIDIAFQKFLIGLPECRLEELRELRKEFGVYLLSNTNPIMWNDSIARLFRSEGKEREDYFDGMATSFEARVMKPDAAIFRYTVDKLGIRPEETLFIDDSQANLDAASALGFHTAQALPGRDFADIIKPLL